MSEERSSGTDITFEKAERKIRELFTSGEVLYYSDILEQTGFDLELIVEICGKLENEGMIGEISRSELDNLQHEE